MTITNIDLTSKTAIITGSGKGIGKAIALTLAKAGANIAVADLLIEEAKKTVQEIENASGKAIAIEVDVAKEEQVKNTVLQTMKVFRDIDILVNNAGMSDGMRPVAFVPDMKFMGWELSGDAWNKPITLDWWHKVLDTNFTSVFLFSQAVAPYMLKKKKGKIINISSTSADLGTPYHSIYCASKAAVSSFTRCLASEWAPYNICVNAIGPGATNTERTKTYIINPECEKAVLASIPKGRIAEPQEIAELVLFLSSESSDFITGQTIFIDGGQIGHGAGAI
ncbi:SDR family NAD(P)-dependent oxidoreductase [Chloroflexota bacterium]